MGHKKGCPCRRCNMTREQEQTWFAQQFAGMHLDLWTRDPQWFTVMTNTEALLVDIISDPVWERHD